MKVGRSRSMLAFHEGRRECVDISGRPTQRGAQEGREDAREVEVKWMEWERASRLMW